jgi:hypothetical protein
VSNNDDQIQLDLNQDQAGQVVQNVPARAQTTLAFRVEQSKIPDFWGQKAKDTVTAIVFIRKIDDLARSNIWNDTTTYANVANAFKRFAQDWLFATADMLDWTEVQLTWTNLKPRFQKQFATQTNDKQIIDGLSNLAMGPNETTGELLARITNTMVIIKESYAAYATKSWNHLQMPKDLDRWDFWRLRQPNGRTTQSTTCCSFSKCNCSELLYLEI